MKITVSKKTDFRESEVFHWGNGESIEIYMNIDEVLKSICDVHKVLYIIITTKETEELGLKFTIREKIQNEIREWELSLSSRYCYHPIWSGEKIRDVIRYFDSSLEELLQIDTLLKIRKQLHESDERYRLIYHC